MKDWKDIEYKVNSYKPALRINKITVLSRENPSMMYYGVRIDTKFDPSGTHLEHFYNEGWTPVMDDEGIKVENEKADSKARLLETDIPKPYVTEGKGGAIYQWMQIAQSDWKKKEVKKRIERDEKFERESKLKITKQGNKVRIVDEEAGEGKTISNN